MTRGDGVSKNKITANAVKVWLPTAIAARELGVYQRVVRAGIQRKSKKYQWRMIKSPRGGKDGIAYEVLTAIAADRYRSLCDQYEREFEIAEGATEGANNGTNGGAGEQDDRQTDRQREGAIGAGVRQILYAQGQAVGADGGSSGRDTALTATGGVLPPHQAQDATPGDYYQDKGGDLQWADQRLQEERINADIAGYGAIIGGDCGGFGGGSGGADHPQFSATGNSGRDNRGQLALVSQISAIGASNHLLGQAPQTRAFAASAAITSAAAVNTNRAKDSATDDAVLRRRLPKLELTNGQITTSDKLTMIAAYHNLRHEGKTAGQILRVFSSLAKRQIGKSTFNDWLIRYRSGGAIKLTDNRGGNRKNVDPQCLTAALKNAVGASFTTALNAYKLALESKYILIPDSKRQLKKLLSISQSGFNRAAKRLAQSQTMEGLLLRGGKDRAVRQISPSVPREKVARTHEFQVDATKLNFAVTKEVLTWDHKLKRLTTTKKIVRATLVAVIDHYSSRFVAGLFDSPNSYANVRILKKAIMTMGKPRFIKIDNGSDYKADHFQLALQQLGIHPIVSRKYRGDDKGSVERLHQTLQTHLEGHPGFLGHNLAKRELIEKMSAYKAERLSGAATAVKNPMTWEQMEAAIDIACEKVCAEKGYTRKYNEGIGAVMMIDEAEINRAIGKRYQRRLGKEGVSINHTYYQSLESSLTTYRGQMVEVAEDIDDVRRVWLYDVKTKEPIGMAKNAYLLERTSEEKRKIERAVDKGTRAAIAAIEKLSDDIDGLKPYVRDADALLAKRKQEALAKKEQDEPLERVNDQMDKLTAIMIELGDRRAKAQKIA
jgi:transposase InsO family protein